MADRSQRFRFPCHPKSLNGIVQRVHPKKGPQYWGFTVGWKPDRILKDWASPGAASYEDTWCEPEQKWLPND